MAIDKIKKRNGSVVDFDRVRIERAMEKAFIATRVAVVQETLESITDELIQILEARFVERIPGVEDVQDQVEKMLAERGYFEVSKAYILYRKQHAELRESRKNEILDKIERRELRVRKRSGEIVDFNIAEIEQAIKNCCHGFDGVVDVVGIIRDTKFAIYDGITTHEINQAIIMALRARIEKDTAYSQVAARLLFNDLYKEVIGTSEFDEGFERTYRDKFKDKITYGVEAGRLDPRLLEFDIDRLARAIKPQRDRLIQYLGAQVLYDRYFLKDLNQDIMENPQYFWMRVAMGLAIEEEDREARAIEFYDIISALRYIPSTPTLFHSGTNHPQMSSCYLTTVDDELSHIMKSIADNAQLSKWSGGLGNDWTNIRATGALIKSTNVGSQGVVPFLKIVDATTAAINRSGKRRGATCVYLETWHYDIGDFLELRKNTGDERRRTHDTNTANWIPDLFMKRVLNDEEWTLFSPNETPELHHVYGKEFETLYKAYEEKSERGEIKLSRKVRAVDLWRKMITMLFETGHPWITFKDACNIRSPQDHVGVVHSSNLCTEITLNTSADETAVCNLGSVNISQHVRDGRLDLDTLQDTVSTAIRMLDNVIDINFYPTGEARNANLRHRPIGLGVMGLQDALYKLDRNFDSKEALDFTDRTQEFIAYHAILASSQLAKEKSPYPSYRGSKWDRGLLPIDTLALLEEERGRTTGVDRASTMDWSPVRTHLRDFGLRNSNCMAIAPTATIANIAGCFPSVEPIYKNIYVKSNFSGEFTIINSYLVDDLKALGLWSDELSEKLKYYDGSVQRIAEIPGHLKMKYKEVFEIDAKCLIDHAALRAKWIDQSQSINIFTVSTSGSLISDIYQYAWEKGLKTTYYLRTLGASAIEKSTLDSSKRYENAPQTEQVPVAVVERDDSHDVPATAVLSSACLMDDPTCEACQ
ncbi:MAG: ribonucleoside-diphosphate reductase subunit alpha [Candidatus Krumholzibacteria bacterium]|nr:ribonucleoside-diphosphate reductase subunit alpha [Candidatus Krumholzibacteria bacterium]